MVIVSRRSVALASRFGMRSVVTGGLVTLAVGLTSLSFVSATTSYLPYGLALVLVATGMGLSVPSLSTGIVTSLPQAQAGVGSGINSAVREVGAALGVAVVGSVLASSFQHSLPPELQGQGHSVFQTLRAAQALGPTVHDQAVAAFTNAMASGLRVVAFVVLLGAIAAARGLAIARREADRTTAPRAEPQRESVPAR